MVASCTALNQVHRLWSAGTRWLTLEYCSRLLLQRGPKGSSRPQLFLRTSPRGPRAAHVRQFRHRGLLHACVHMYPPSVAVCNINIHLAQERCPLVSAGYSVGFVCTQVLLSQFAAVYKNRSFHVVIHGQVALAVTVPNTTFPYRAARFACGVWAKAGVAPGRRLVLALNVWL